MKQKLFLYFTCILFKRNDQTNEQTNEQTIERTNKFIAYGLFTKQLLWF